MYSLELCKPCKGSGRLGIMDGVRLVCESCAGIGRVWEDRASMYDSMPIR